MVPQPTQVRSPVPGLGLRLGGQAPEETPVLEKKGLRIRPDVKFECRHLKRHGRISDASRQTSLPVLQGDLRIGYGVSARHTRACANKWRQMRYREWETRKNPCFWLLHGVR